MTNLTILIPAAGSASRMRGTDKLLERIGGVPLLTRQVSMALSVAPVTVTLRLTDPDRCSALTGLNAAILHLTDAHLGMSASFRAVARCGTAVMVLPADMPDLTRDDLAAMIAVHRLTPDLIVQGSCGPKPGHPVIWPADLVPGFAGLQGDHGARSMLQTHRDRRHLHPLPGQHALTDLDTPEDWAAWRTIQAASSTRAS